MTEILVLYYSAGGSVREMAHLVARGVNQVPGASARVTLPTTTPRSRGARHVKESVPWNAHMSTTVAGGLSA